MVGFCESCYLMACGVDLFQAYGVCWVVHYIVGPGKRWSHNQSRKCLGEHIMTGLEGHTYLTGK